MSPTPTTDDLELDELQENLAAIEHERWAHWQKWCHKVLRENNPSPEIGDVLERWDRQIETPYDQLSESEKQSDRNEVARYWPLVQEYMTKSLDQAKAALTAREARKVLEARVNGRIEALREVVGNANRKSYHQDLLNQALKDKKRLTHLHPEAKEGEW